MTANAGAPPRPDEFDIIILGTHYKDWLEVLGPGSPLWKKMPGVASASHRGDGWLGDVGNDGSRQLVIPLLETNIRELRHACWTLKPSSHALETLADKQLFADHLNAEGLADYMPEHYSRPEDARFPALVKVTNATSGIGITVVNSVEEIAQTTARPCLIQEYVEGPVDYSVHGLIVGGKIVWHQAYTFPVNPDNPIRHPRRSDKPVPVDVRAYDLMVMQQIVGPISFDGPTNFNYRIRKSGNAAFFEINPRIGGSLFRQEGYADLKTMISHIIANATWQRGQAS